MHLGSIIWEELLQEATATRKLFERIPMDKLDFKPHEKSMTLGRITTHVCEITGWWKECLINDELDFSVGDFKPRTITSTEELLAMHDDLVAKAEVILKDSKNEDFDKIWTMKNGEIIYFSLPKSVVVRTWCMNHLYHHRGQLTVYLRLLDVPLTSIYGPTADDVTM